jgi:drug/metabolite transporter (DMT)-like permease
LSIGIFLAVLGAAFLHALWNGLVKTGGSRAGAMAILSVAEIAIGIVASVARPLPGADVLPWLAASAVFHLIYKTCLTFAYEHGDLSRVYPLARGTAPMAVLVIGALFLGEVVSATEAAGILVLGAGIVLLASGVLRGDESRRLLPFAFGAAFGTAGYTLVDGLGARVAGDGPLYVGWLFAIDGVTYLALMLALRGRGILVAAPRGWGVGAVAGLASYGAYAIAVWAMTRAAIPLVAALRETSILFAVLIGWLAFGERMTRGKWISVALIAAGVALTRLRVS